MKKEEIVKLIRLGLYNKGACCGAKSLKIKWKRRVSNLWHLKEQLGEYYHAMV